MGLQNLLNASRTSEVDDMTNAKCGKPVESLMRRIATTFPAARIIVTGYYPFFSAETRNNFVVKAPGSSILKSQPDGAPRMSSKEVFERLKVNPINGTKPRTSDWLTQRETSMQKWDASE